MDRTLRIGELSRRTGVPAPLLRAWERRYRLLQPERSEGGYRLYSESDVERIHAMRAHLDAGISAAQAARLALEPRGRDSSGARSLLAALALALDNFDGAAAHDVFDRALSALTVDAVLGGVVLPYLADLGARWERGEASVAQEHFASSLLRGRLLGLARGWDRGSGPRAVLACAPNELHDLPLIVFGLALRERGWRIVYLGADTPVETVEEVARSLDPDVTVISATTSEPVRESLTALRRLARTTPLALAGPGASGVKIRASFLAEDPIAEADRLASDARGA